MVRAAQVLARAKPPAELRKRRPGAEAYLARLEDELGLRSDDNLAFLPVRTGKQDLTAIIDLKRTVGWVELTRNPAIFKLNDLQDAGIHSVHPSLPRYVWTNSTVGAIPFLIARLQNALSSVYSGMSPTLARCNASAKSE